jgi:hypothetical protein
MDFQNGLNFMLSIRTHGKYHVRFMIKLNRWKNNHQRNTNQKKVKLPH